MSLTHLGWFAAFAAGLLSFLSPCVLPLIPGYLSYLAGTSIQEAEEGGNQKSQHVRVGLHALWFVLGFVLMFALLGTGAAVLGGALRAYQQWLARIAGLLLILFGVVLTGLIPVPLLSRDYRLEVKQGTSSWWRTGLIGMTFAAGWSGCFGPLLGSILVLATSATTLVQGISFLLAYALGLGIPFLLVGVLLDRISPPLRGIRRVSRFLSRGAGMILILMGMLVFTGRLDQLAIYLSPFSLSP